MPMFLLMSTAFYMVGVNGGRNRNYQKALRVLVLKYIWCILGMAVWTCGTISSVIDIEKSCFQKSRVIVLINFLIIGIIGFFISTILLMMIICCLPYVISSFAEIKDFFHEEFDFTAVGGNSHRITL